MAIPNPAPNTRTHFLFTILLLFFLTAVQAHPLKSATHVTSHLNLLPRYRNSTVHHSFPFLVSAHLRNGSSTRTLVNQILDDSPDSLLSDNFRKHPPAVLRQEQIPTGLTLDSCTENQDCATTPSGDRVCVFLDFPESSDCTSGANDCQCAPTFDPQCSTDADCDDGEICGTRFADGAMFCVSENFFQSNPSDFLRNETVSSGLTGDSCRSKDDCRGNRICIEDDPESLTCPEGTNCFCFLPTSPARCAVDWDCALGEICAILLPSAEPNSDETDPPEGNLLDRFCVSSDAVTLSDSFVGVFEQLGVEDENPGTTGETGRMGLSYELCEQEDECQDGNTCKADRFSGGSNCGPRGCRCFPEEDVTCVDSTVCPEGEVCAAILPDFRIGVCISQAAVVQMEPALSELGQDGGFTAEFPGGLTGDRCLFDMDCKGTRRCETDTEAEELCPVWGVCFCFKPLGEDITCQTSADCEEGEGCFTGLPEPVCLSESAGMESSFFTPVRETPPPTTDTGSTADSVDIDFESVYSGSVGSEPVDSEPADTPTPTTEASNEMKPDTVTGDGPEAGTGTGPEPTTTTTSPEMSSGSGNSGGDVGNPEVEDAVCMDARMVADLDRRELVYEKDRWAKVFCDGWGSCATRGHVVVWEGKAMMMATYCAEVTGGCEEREMWVNSPRWRTGRRVAGRGGGLEFTALAARWATRWEEAVLRVVVHAGL